jgi:hypothetical protein
MDMMADRDTDFEDKSEWLCWLCILGLLGLLTNRTYQTFSNNSRVVTTTMTIIASMSRNSVYSVVCLLIYCGGRYPLLKTSIVGLLRPEMIWQEPTRLAKRDRI